MAEKAKTEKPKATTTKRSRSAVTGKIVSADEAKKNPATTITETVKKEDKLTYSQRQERDEKKRVEDLLAKGWFYTEWGELVPPQVEIDNRKPADREKAKKADKKAKGGK